MQGQASEAELGFTDGLVIVAVMLLLAEALMFQVSQRYGLPFEPDPSTLANLKDTAIQFIGDVFRFIDALLPR